MSGPSKEPASQSYWLPEVREIRRSSPDYLHEISTTLRSLGAATLNNPRLLDGGVMSACYELNDRESPLVVKFSAATYPVLGRVLELWREHDVKVPRVHDYGIVPSTEFGSPLVSYTVMESVSHDNGNIAPQASKVTDREPALAGSIGRLVGSQLARIHGIKADEDEIGSQSVIEEMHLTSGDWGDYLAQMVRRHRLILGEIDYSDLDIERLAELLKSIGGNAPVGYLHNDPAMTNVLVTNDEFPEIRLIDPNPMIGNGHWDLAHNANYLDFYMREIDADPSDEILKSRVGVQQQYFDGVRDSYEQTTGNRISDSLLLAGQLGRSIKSLAYFRLGNKEWFKTGATVVKGQIDKILKL